jgi:prefoldin subunit 5
MTAIAASQMSLELTDSSTLSTEERSIPKALFISDIDGFAKKYGVEPGIAGLRELHAKYSFMYESLLTQKRSLLRKMPDIQQSLETVQHVQAQTQAFSTFFPLTDNTHAQAVVEPCEKICLWLGANVMLEYSLEEAEQLLTASSQSAAASLASIDKSMAFLREQITTTEVNIARVHNFNVALRQNQQQV